MLLAVVIAAVPVPVPAVAVSAVAVSVVAVTVTMTVAVTVAVVVAVVLAIVVLKLELLAAASRGFLRPRVFLGSLSFAPDGLPRFLPVGCMLGGGMEDEAGVCVLGGGMEDELLGGRSGGSIGWLVGVAEVRSTDSTRPSISMKPSSSAGLVATSVVA